jgi:hypothetical protein
MDIRAGIEYLRRLDNLIDENESSGNMIGAMNTELERTGALLMFAAITGKELDQVYKMVRVF